MANEQEVLFITNRRRSARAEPPGFDDAPDDADVARLTMGAARIELTRKDARRTGLAPRDPNPVRGVEIFEGAGETAMAERLLAALEAGSDIILYIHGFDTTFDDAVWYGAQIGLNYNGILNEVRDSLGNLPRMPQDLKVIIFSWPADSRDFLRQSPLALLTYLSDLTESGRRSPPAVATLLDFWAERIAPRRAADGAARVHLMCQSMGVRIFRYGFQRWLGATKANAHLFDTITFTGSDEDSDAFSRSDKLAALPRRARITSVYHNSDDRLGKLSRLLRWLALRPKAERRRMSRYGPAKPGSLVDVHAIDVSGAVARFIAAQAALPEAERANDRYGHYYARLNREVIEDILRIMSSARFTGGNPNDLPGRAKDGKNDYHLIERR